MVLFTIYLASKEGTVRGTLSDVAEEALRTWLAMYSSITSRFCSRLASLLRLSPLISNAEGFSRPSCGDRVLESNGRDNGDGDGVIELDEKTSYAGGCTSRPSAIGVKCASAG